MLEKLFPVWVKKALGLHAAQRRTHVLYRHSARSRRSAATPRLEGLEDRTVLSTFWVTNTGDNGGVNPVAGAGTGTLRQGIIDADAAGGGTAAHPDQIDFNIPSTDPGYRSSTRSFLIMPTSALPVITDVMFIDGTSEPGFTGTPNIVVNGGLAGNGNGLDITAGNSTVDGTCHSAVPAVRARAGDQWRRYRYRQLHRYGRYRGPGVGQWSRYPGNERQQR